MPIEHDFQIGADPEFAAVNSSGYLVNPGTVYHNGCGGAFGVDGAGTVFELRPAPSTEPADVVNSLRKAMIRGLTESVGIRRTLWRAGSLTDGNTTGGHIHFGFNHSTSEVKNGWRTRFNRSSSLDKALGMVCLALDSSKEFLARQSHGYGQLGDIRTDHPHGPEYRPLPSWLTSPYVALGILSLAKVVAYSNVVECMALGDSIAAEFYTIWTRGQRDKARKVAIEEIRPAIEACSLHKTYQDNYKLLFDLIADGKSWFPKGGMRAAWGLPTNLVRIRLSDAKRMTAADIFA